MMKACLICGKMFTPIGKNQYGIQKYCSKKCKYKAYDRTRAPRRSDYFKRKRFDLIQKLGGKCVACGITDKYLLTFDHINDDRNGRKNDYYFVKEGLEDIKSFKEYIQILCWNCNELKQHYKHVFRKRYTHLL